MEDKDNRGYTALIMAVEFDCVETVKMLLENGADPTARTNDGRTAMWFAQSGKLTGVLNVLRQHFQ